MSLYGLDIIVRREEQRVLTEINGINSGMSGFQQIYGDNRVQEQVFEMLQEKYGKLTVNDGSYAVNLFKKKHPLLFAANNLLLKTPLARPLLFLTLLLHSSPVLYSEKAETEWLQEDAKNAKILRLPFESYTGQESTVMNILNERLLHPTVNPIVTEEITRNKFLQYLLLKDSSYSEAMPESTLVGLGATDEDELNRMLFEYDAFVAKPILGNCGRGVRFLNREEVERKYRFSRGPTRDLDMSDALLSLLKKEAKTIYIEDFIREGNFSFEAGVSILQPFIDSQEQGEYSIVRAIVCNGKFVDAYQRKSHNLNVNLSQDATAHSFDYDADFVHFCESLVEEFEFHSQRLPLQTFRKDLYQRFLNQRGETSETQRSLDSSAPLMNELAASIQYLSRLKQ